MPPKSGKKGGWKEKGPEEWGAKDKGGKSSRSWDHWDDYGDGGDTKGGGKGRWGESKDKGGKASRQHWDYHEEKSGKATWDDSHWEEPYGKGGDYGARKGKGSKHSEREDRQIEASSAEYNTNSSRPLNSSAPQFQPSGMYGGLSQQFWGWPSTPMQAPMMTVWTEYKADDGTPYYYNSRTGLTQWDRPPELDPPKPPPPDVPAPSAEERRGQGPGGRDRPSRDGPGKGGDRDILEHRDGDRDRERREQRKVMEDNGKGGGQARQNRRRGGKPDEAARKKEGSEFGPPGCNLFVFHLPDDWTDDDLNEYFAPHGSLVSAKVMKELGTGRSRGFGFVSYDDRVSAATAIKKMQGYKILGKRLKVEFKKGEQDGKGDGGDGDDDETGGGRKTYPDDERLIGYLRAISAKNVVQSLKESEGGQGADDDEGQALEAMLSEDREPEGQED